MKIASYIATTLTLLFLVGCLTTGVKYSKNDPTSFSAYGWTSGSLQTEGKRVSDNEHYLTVKGAARCSEQDVLDEANRVATLLADGAAFETEFAVKPYRYTSTNGMLWFNHNATKVEGLVTLLP